MGGGGAVRAAAKAAGLGIQNAGIRGGLPENIASARKASRQSASAISSTASVDDTSRLEFTAVSQTAPPLTWELDDWEFDGYGLEEQPRLVFGPAPSLTETKEATSELRDALDKMYFSRSNSAEGFNSVSAVDDRSVVSKSDTQNCVVDQTSAPLVPNQALKAFKLLKENPATQTVVASIAADPNVWNAVLQNDALQEYLQSEKQCMASEEQKALESCEATLVIQDAGNSEDGFVKAYKNVKLAVAGWVNSLSGYFQDLFGGPDDKTASEAASSSSNSTMVKSSLLGLAVMVIMIVIMKRG